MKVKTTSTKEGSSQVDVSMTSPSKPWLVRNPQGYDLDKSSVHRENSADSFTGLIEMARHYSPQRGQPPNPQKSKGPSFRKVTELKKPQPVQTSRRYKKPPRELINKDQQILVKLPQIQSSREDHLYGDPKNGPLTKSLYQKSTRHNFFQQMSNSYHKLYDQPLSRAQQKPKGLPNRPLEYLQHQTLEISPLLQEASLTKLDHQKLKNYKLPSRYREHSRKNKKLDLCNALTSQERKRVKQNYEFFPQYRPAEIRNINPFTDTCQQFKSLSHEACATQTSTAQEKQSPRISSVQATKLMFNRILEDQNDRQKAEKYIQIKDQLPQFQSLDRAPIQNATRNRCQREQRSVNILQQLSDNVKNIIITGR